MTYVLRSRREKGIEQRVVEESFVPAEFKWLSLHGI